MSSRRHLTWKELSMEFIAGILFFVALAILATFTIILSREDFFSKAAWQVGFPDVAGLSEGDNVLLHGVIIGRVKKISLVNDEVTVALRLNQDAKLYRDYVIEIRYSSVLGGRHVAVNPGSPAAGEVLPGTRLVGRPTPDLVNETTRLIQEIKVEWDKLSQTLEKEQVIPRISKFVDDMSAMSADLRAGKGTLGKLMQDATLYDQATQTLSSVKGAGDNLNGILADAEKGKGTVGKLLTDDSLFTQYRDIAADLRAGKGTLGKLLGDDQLYNDLRATTTDLRQISDSVAKGNSSLGKLVTDKGELYLSLKNTLGSAEEVAQALRDGKGTLGKLAMDPTLYQETRQTILEVRGAVQDFREQAPVSTFGGLVLGAF